MDGECTTTVRTGREFSSEIECLLDMQLDVSEHMSENSMKCPKCRVISTRSGVIKIHTVKH